MSRLEEDIEALRLVPLAMWVFAAVFAMWGGLGLGAWVIRQRYPQVTAWGWASVGALALVFALLTALLVRAVIIRRSAPTADGETRLASPDGLRALTGEALPALDGSVADVSTGHLPGGRRYVACGTATSLTNRRHVLVGLNGSPRTFAADTTRLGWRLPEGMDAGVARLLMRLSASQFRSARVVDGWLDLELTAEDEEVAHRAFNAQARAVEVLAAAIEAGPQESAFATYETGSR